MEFLACSNQTMEVRGARNFGSYGSQMGFQQVASIIFFSFLLNSLYLKTLLQNQQLYNKPIFGIHNRWFRLFVPLPIFIRQFDFFWRRGKAIKRRGTYPTSSQLPSYLSKLSPSLLSYIPTRQRFDTFSSVSLLLLSSNCWCLSTASILRYSIRKQY